jgi:hypothetical protein
VQDRTRNLAYAPLAREHEFEDLAELRRHHVRSACANSVDCDAYETERQASGRRTRWVSAVNWEVEITLRNRSPFKPESTKFVATSGQDRKDKGKQRELTRLLRGEELGLQQVAQRREAVVVVHHA